MLSIVGLHNLPIKLLIFRKKSKKETVCSVVSVADNPTFELDAVAATFTFHTVTNVDLTQLIVGDDQNEEGERRDTEVRESDGARAQHQVEEGNVGQDGDEGSLEEETKDHVAVDHTLLGDGQVTGLANEQVGPLHNHNRDKVTTLSVAEGFSRVADLSVGNGGDAVESGDFSATGVPSAVAP